MGELSSIEQEIINPKVIYEGQSIVVKAQPFTHRHLTKGMVDVALTAAGSSTLIGEYFGPDMDWFFNRCLIKSDSLASSTELDEALNSIYFPPKVICCDPAHNSAWAAINISLQGYLALGTTPLAEYWATQALQSHKDKRITRRNFLIGATATAATASSLSVAGFIQKFSEQLPQTPGMVPPNPQHLRRLVIAKNIFALDRLLNKPKPGGNKTNLLLLYPEVHIQGIEALLNNPSWNFADEQSAMALLQISDFSHARIYKPAVNENGQTVWSKSSINLHKSGDLGS